MLAMGNMVVGKQSQREGNIRFFKENLGKWLEDVAYRHKYVIISDQEVKGVYDGFQDALKFAVDNGLVPGEHIIQEVIGEDERISFLKSAL